MSDLPLLTFNKRAISSGNMNAIITSDALDISDVLYITAQEIWSGAPVGNIIIEASNDGVNYEALDTQAAGGGSGHHAYNSPALGWKWVRARWAFVSGTGTLDVYITGKKV